MRSILLLALAPLFVSGAQALEIVRPVVSQMEGGAPDTPGFEHVPGETLFFTCRIATYSKSPESRIHIAYSVQAFDPKGVPLVEVYKNEISDEVAPQDKNWLPKVETSIPLPPLLATGTYKIVVKAEDLFAKLSTELAVPVNVRGRDVEASDTLAVRNFRFFRGEEATQPLEPAAYRSGDGLWARLDIVGFRYGEKNKVDVSYVVSILGASGKVLWTQPEPAAEQSESFYPKRYVSGSLGLSLKGTKPGAYTMLVQVKDAIGDQSTEARQTFKVE